MFAAAAMLVLAQSPDFAAWGAEALEMIRREYYIPKRKLYAEKPDKKQPSFNWDVGVMLSALNAAAQYDGKYKPMLREYADATRVYWNKGGYDVLPTPKPKDRYYDDNAWMAMALVDTYAVLGDKKYLDWAKGALDFALSGGAKSGGIFWRESDKASRNTCSNGPTAAACLAIYAHTHEERLTRKAKEIFDWTRMHLEDPADGLFWDNLSNAGKIDKTKWSYNTALMIRTAKDLGDHSYERMLASSKARWLKKGRIADGARFAHLLFEAWVRVEGVQPDLEAALAAIHQSRSKKGFFPSDWNRLSVPDSPELIDQASFARACFILANARHARR